MDVLVLRVVDYPIFKISFISFDFQAFALQQPAAAYGTRGQLYLNIPCTTHAIHPFCCNTYETRSRPSTFCTFYIVSVLHP